MKEHAWRTNPATLTIARDPATGEIGIHKVGDHYSVQGNILVGPEVIEAMAAAFEKTPGPALAPTAVSTP